LAQEFAPRVRVNAIGVGSTKTDALNTVLTDEIEKVMVELTPMARLAEVEDIALGALYLASPAASYITGHVLGIHGGLERLNMAMPRAFGGMG
jgi:7-alpha-hydroxysteroid dehydrogenase